MTEQLETTIAALRVAHRNRRFMMKAQQRNDRSLESFVRRNYTDWTPDMSEAERNKRNKQVKAILKKARNGEGDADLIRLAGAVDIARAPFDEERAKYEKLIKKIAATLPVFAWTETVPGIAALGLGTIIAETGGLHNYGNPAKVWKRLGFAPYDGLAGSTWKRESWRPRALTKEEWVANPFSGERYALMHQQAQFLWMAQWIGAEVDEETGDVIKEGEPDGRYGEIYAARRKHTATTHPDWTKQHSHRDGLRVAFKKFLADLWTEWNDRLDHRVLDAHYGCVEPVEGAADQRPRDAHDAPVRRATKSRKRSGPDANDALSGIAGSRGAADPHANEAPARHVRRATKQPRASA